MSSWIICVRSINQISILGENLMIRKLRKLSLFCLFVFRLAVGHKYHTVFWTTISRRELHMDRKAKATKKRQKLNLKEANGYKAEADNFAPQEQPIGKVNTEKASKLNHFAPAACSPPPCLSSISTPV